MKAVLAPADALEPEGKLKKGMILARVDGELAEVDSAKVDYIDISPKQIVGISAALIPFLEHDDANRALMGSNMQRQAVPLIKVDPPCIATGMEKPVGTTRAWSSGQARGTVTFVDAERIIIDNADEYVLRKFVGLNERTCQNQRPIVKPGQKVEKGEILADGASRSRASSRSARTCWSRSTPSTGTTSRTRSSSTSAGQGRRLHEHPHRRVRRGDPRDQARSRGVHPRHPQRLGEDAPQPRRERHHPHRRPRRPRRHPRRQGQPQEQDRADPEEKLLHAIFGRAGEDVKNDSLEVPAGVEGVVIGARKFSRRMHMNEEQKKQLKKDIEDYEQSMDEKAIELFKQMVGLDQRGPAPRWSTR
jgi:DNA-directed RNA polymerase subunit beta